MSVIAACAGNDAARLSRAAVAVQERDGGSPRLARIEPARTAHQRPDISDFELMMLAGPQIPDDNHGVVVALDPATHATRSSKAPASVAGRSLESERLPNR